MATDDDWSVAASEDDGKPLVIRVRIKPPSFATRRIFLGCW